MNQLKVFEKKVLDLMVSSIIADELLKDIKNSPNIIEYTTTGNGYFLTIKHPSLPYHRIVCDRPILIGEYEGINTGFVIFIEKNELIIECHGWDDKSIPESFRNCDVKVYISEDSSIIPQSHLK